MMELPLKLLHPVLFQRGVDDKWAKRRGNSEESFGEIKGEVNVCMVRTKRIVHVHVPIIHVIMEKEIGRDEGECCRFAPIS